jgi:hypothetical protein
MRRKSSFFLKSESPPNRTRYARSHPVARQLPESESRRSRLLHCICQHSLLKRIPVLHGEIDRCILTEITGRYNETFRIRMPPPFLQDRGAFCGRVLKSSISEELRKSDFAKCGNETKMQNRVIRNKQKVAGRSMGNRGNWSIHNPPPERLQPTQNKTRRSQGTTGSGPRAWVRHHARLKM